MADNIKVHFVVGNSLGRIVPLKAANVQYMLFSALNFIEHRSSDQNMHTDSLHMVQAGFKHTIVDSGLFTMMFGSGKGKDHDEGEIREWMHRIVRFSQDNDIPNASFVECDCQKIVGVEAAWRLRREMRELMPGREIINVFHLPDGEDGFRRLVEWSDYIAISVPELRISQPKGYRKNVHMLASLARRLRPEIKIHLLGCTEYQMLHDNRFCTSADSSSWSSPSRFGYLKGHHVDTMRREEIEQAKEECRTVARRTGLPLTQRSEEDAGRRLVEARWYRAQYELCAGNQD